MPLAQTATPEPEVKSPFRDLNPIGGGPRIRLSRSALNQLEVHVREGVKAINGRGVEIGGVVLGSSSIDWNAAEVTITGFLPVEIEYRFGPAFRPSETDIAIFKESVLKEGDKVVGYFRSQLRDGFAVREEDSRLLGQLFPSSDCCFISIHASARTPSNVDLYQVRPGTAPELVQLFALKERERTAPVVEKPPAAPLARPAQEAAVKGASAPVPIPSKPTPVASPNPAAAPPVVAPPAAVPPDLAANRSGLLWTVGGIVAALTIAAIAYTVGQRSVPGSEPPPARAARTFGSMAGDPKIGLHVVERGSQLDIRWNPSDPAIATATRGMLIITDGAGTGGIDPSARAPGDIDLNTTQLLSGVFSYKPIRNTITVLLMIYQPSGSFTGDMQQFTGSHPDPLPRKSLPLLNLSAIPAVRESTLPAAPLKDSPTKTTPPIVQARTAAPVSTPVPAEPVREAAVPVPVKAPSRTWSSKLPAAVSKATRVPTVLEPPPPAPGATAASGPQLPLLSLLAPPVAAPSASTLPYHTGPIQFFGPEVIHQAVPAIPLGVASKIRTEIQMEVMVAVDAAGKVTAARVVSSRGPAAGLLTIETLKAAQLCRFKPAQQDGHPVPSSTVVTFRFAPRPN